MNNIIKTLLIAGISLNANAHEVWINTGSFELNSDKQTTYSLDVSRSVEAFIAEANHDVNYLNVVSPTGKKSRLDAAFSGKNKEVFEHDFTENGTYHFRSPVTHVFLTFYRDAAGKKHKIGLSKSQYDELPEHSKVGRTVEKQIVTEAYISYNGFSTPQYNQAQQGITLIPSKHPNMFTVGDKIGFTASFAGKPLANAELSIKSLNSIYDPDLEKIELTTNENGRVEFTPSESGRYIVAVEHSMQLHNHQEADQRSVELFLSFDVVD